jgi:hypothetical protein
MLGTTLGVFFFSGILLLAPSPVLAQGSDLGSTQRLTSEYQRLRVDLDRVNAEVAALRSGGRSVRKDYLLRDKLAEAEALARKVTAAEARLRAARGPLPTESMGGTIQAPVATPQDGAVEFEAKADLLSDQARRFRAEAEALARTAEQIRARQALRRRAGAWDRDPLAGFEASKRVAVIPTQGSRATIGASGESSGSSAVPRAATPSSSDTTAKAGGSGVLGVGATPPPTATSDSAGPGVATSVPAVSGPYGPTPVVAPPPTPPAAPLASHPLTAPAPLSSDSASKAGVQQRTLLDPATLAGIRGSVSQAGSLSDPDAVEAAVTALRQHAQALEERARLLRARAGQR